MKGPSRPNMSGEGGVASVMAARPSAAVAAVAAAVGAPHDSALLVTARLSLSQ